MSEASPDRTRPERLLLKSREGHIDARSIAVELTPFDRNLHRHAKKSLSANAGKIDRYIHLLGGQRYRDVLQVFGTRERPNFAKIPPAGITTPALDVDDEL